MAEKAPRWEAEAPRFQLRSLVRLAAWGLAAVGATGLMAWSATSSSGSQRLMAAVNGGGQQMATIQQPGRPAEPDLEVKRLSDVVRSLAADRERLLARVTLLERNLEDMTGSIKRQSTGSFPPTSLPQIAPAPTAAPVMTAPAAKDEPVAPPARTAAVSPEPTPAEPVRTDHGADIGGATNYDGLRTLWHSVKGSNGALFESLYPVVVARENPRTHTPELRLVVGPLADADAASQLCTTLTAARRYCQPAAFDGQRLTDADAPPKPKPVAQPKAAPAPPARTGIRLFQ